MVAVAQSVRALDCGSGRPRRWLTLFQAVTRRERVPAMASRASRQREGRQDGEGGAFRTRQARGGRRERVRDSGLVNAQVREGSDAVHGGGGRGGAGGGGGAQGGGGPAPARPPGAEARGGGVLVGP